MGANTQSVMPIPFWKGFCRYYTLQLVGLAFALTGAVAGYLLPAVGPLLGTALGFLAFVVIVPILVVGFLLLKGSYNGFKEYLKTGIDRRYWNW